MTDQLYAYTSPISWYPEYLNVSGQDNGSTILVVSSQGESTTSRINIPPDELIKLGKALIARGEEVLGG